MFLYSFSKHFCTYLIKEWPVSSHRLENSTGSVIFVNLTFILYKFFSGTATHVRGSSDAIICLFYKHFFCVKLTLVLSYILSRNILCLHVIIKHASRRSWPIPIKVYECFMFFSEKLYVAQHALKFLNRQADKNCHDHTRYFPNKTLYWLIELIR